MSSKKKIVLASVIVGAGIISLLAMGSTNIKPGTTGIVVNLLGDSKGIVDDELRVGLHYLPPWKSVYRFPTFEQNHSWEDGDAFYFQTSEGLSVRADIGITYNLVPERIHDLFCKYRRGMEEITHSFVRNNIRDAINRYASSMKIEELYGPQKEVFFNNILEKVRSELTPQGFNISRVYIIGDFHVPDSVKTAISNKIEAIQRAQQRENELKEAQAEARKKIAAAEGEAQSRLLTAEADARANELIRKSINTGLIMWQAVKNWNGVLPKVMSDLPMLLEKVEE